MSRQLQSSYYVSRMFCLDKSKNTYFHLGYLFMVEENIMIFSRFSAPQKSIEHKRQVSRKTVKTTYNRTIQLRMKQPDLKCQQRKYLYQSCKNISFLRFPAKKSSFTIHQNKCHRMITHLVRENCQIPERGFLNILPDL